MGNSGKLEKIWGKSDRKKKSKSRAVATRAKNESN